MSKTTKIFNRVTRTLFGKALFVRPINWSEVEANRRPLEPGAFSGEFGATASTVIPDDLAKSKMEAYRARLRALPNKESDNFPLVIFCSEIT